MKTCHVPSGEAIDLAAARQTGATSSVLLQTDELKVVLLNVPAGHKSAPHVPASDITMQCLEGRVTVTIGTAAHPLSAGQLLYVSKGQQHAMEAADDSVLLMTKLVRADCGDDACGDVVDEASRESFPASDAPSYTRIVRP